MVAAREPQDEVELLEEASLTHSNSEAGEDFIAGPSRSWRTPRLLAVASTVIGVICAVMLMKQEQPASTAAPPSAAVDDRITEYAFSPTDRSNVSTFPCGGYDLAALNDFGSQYDANPAAGIARMESAGWIFSKTNGEWEGSAIYRPSLYNIGGCPCQQPPATSWYGWDYPGDGVLRLPLQLPDKTMTARLVLDVGNAYTDGQVIVSFDGIKQIGIVPANTMSKVFEVDFKDGYMLTLCEANPRGIMVINSISFQCSQSTLAMSSLGASYASAYASALGSIKGAAAASAVAASSAVTSSVAAEGSASSVAAGGFAAHSLGNRDGLLKAETEPQWIDRAKWEIYIPTDVSCKDFCVKDKQPASPWGTSQAIIDRTWCATACLSNTTGEHAPCVGFLYPDPPADQQGLVTTSDECQLMSRHCEGASDNICHHAMNEYAFHRLVERHVSLPPYPEDINQIH